MNAVPTSSKWRWAIVLAVVLLTLAAHLRGLDGDFLLWDDDSHITQNAAIRSLSLEHLRTMFTGHIAKLYCPLTWVSLAVDYQLWGRNPFGFHLTNQVLHLANTLLVMMLVYQLLRDRVPRAEFIAALTAAIFGVHPLRVESVAWATERKDVLFAFFFFLALAAYLEWTTSRKRWAYWSCFLLFVASTLSKSAAVTLPVVFLLLDYFWSKRVALAEKIPFFVVSAIIAVETFVAQAGGKGETVATADIIPVVARIGLVGYCGLFYVGKFLAPFHLSAIYPSFDEMGWTVWTGSAWAFAFVAVTAVVVALRRRAPVLLPAWLFYLVTLSPTIGLVPVGIHVVADYYSYVPLLGLALAASVGIVACGRQFPVVNALTGALVIGLTVLSARYTAAWANTETLFNNVLAEYPRCLPAHVNLTLWHTSHKKFEQAIAHGRQAVEIAPAGLPGRKNFAFALINAGRPREAADVLRVAVDHGVDDADVWRGLYECFSALGDEPNAQAAKKKWDRFVTVPSKTQNP